jgi:hypothetical protein
VTRSLFGASGWIILNNDRDRATADYELWVIVKKDLGYEWKQVGLYISSSDSITWL